MTNEDAVARLTAIDAGDPEGAHGTADDIILEWIEANGGPEIAEAYADVVQRARWWGAG